jgi:four helix bundle protein
MRDHRKLEVFQLADELAIGIYAITRHFPDNEKFGLTSQLRRSAISVGANIVEGSSRASKADYIRFLGIAYGSARELEYEISIATRLGYIAASKGRELERSSSRTCRALYALIAALNK